MKTLVTGGGGFIGSNVVRALLARGDDVRVLDNFSTGSRANLAGLEHDVELVEGDLRSYERVHAAVRGVEVVFHQGALPSVPRSVQDPLTTTAVNIEGTLNVLLAARDEGVRRIVNASSSSVYGNTGDAPARRDAGARSDLSVRRREARGGALLHELQPRVRDGDRLAALLQRLRAAAGPDVAVRSRRPALHPRDRGRRAGDDLRRRRAVARLHLRRQRRRREPPRSRRRRESSGEILNVATGGSVTVNALADAIGALLGKPVEKSYEPAREGDVRASWADVSEARRLLGYEPQVDFDDGLRRTADFLLGKD